MWHWMLHVEGLDVVMCAKHQKKQDSPSKNGHSSHCTILELILTALHMIGNEMKPI